MAFQYVYDKAGRLTLDRRTAYWQTGDAVPAAPTAPASFTYSDPLSYDSTHQLQQAGAESYQHSSGGNPQQYHGGSVSVGTGNRLLADRNWTYTHDAEGNLIQKVAKDPPGALFSPETGESSTNKWTYTYDHANRLVRAVKSDKTDPSNTPLATVTYDYDVFGQRIFREAQTPGNLETTYFAYDGANVYADLDYFYFLQRRYVRGDAPDQLFARVDGASASWYLADRQGSVVTVVTGDGQQVQKRLAYRGFSALPVCECSWVGFSDRYEYTGREFDATTRLQYNRARWYNPYSGQWVSEDPEGFGAGDTNLYRYAGNSPTNAKDPSGRDWTWDDTGQVALWALDNTIGMPSSILNKFYGMPDWYGAIRHENAWRLIPFSTWYFDGKSVWDSYQAYKADGMSEEDAIGFTVAHHTPFVSSVFGIAEIIAGYSSRPGEVGKALTPGDYATRGLNVVRDAGLIYVGARGPLPRFRGRGAGQGTPTASAPQAQGRPIVPVEHGTPHPPPGFRPVAPRTGNPNAPRPVIKTNLPDAVTKELPPGVGRTGKVLEQTRNFASRYIREARAWWKARTGEQWPFHADPKKAARGELQWAEHPRALAKGGDPLFIEPGKGISRVEPHIKSGESSEFGKRPPAPGNRPRGRPPKGTPPKPTRPPGRPPNNPPAPPSEPSLFPDPPES